MAFILFACVFPQRGVRFSSAGIPLGIWLAFSWDMGLNGIWIGLSMAVVYLAAVGTYLSLKTDWDREVKKVVERMKEEERLRKRMDEEGGLLH